MRDFPDGHPDWWTGKQRRLRPWVARAVYAVLALLFGASMAYVAWGAGEDWSQMPAHGTWSAQAGQVMDEQGMTWEQEPFSANGLPRWQPWEVRGVPIAGRFSPTK